MIESIECSWNDALDDFEFNKYDQDQRFTLPMMLVWSKYNRVLEYKTLRVLYHKLTLYKYSIGFNINISSNFGIGTFLMCLHAHKV